MSYDPETDTASSPNRAKIKAAYERLRRRGEDDRAEDFREARNMREQLTLADQVADFDPEHDPADSSSKLFIGRVVEALEERGETDQAEALASVEDIGDQHERARTLTTEYELGVRR